VRNRNTVSSTAGVISRHPREAVGVLVMGAAVMMIFVNALFMQHGPHPAPIFAPKLAVAPVPLPRAFVPQSQPLAPQQAVAAVPSPAPRPHAVTEPRRNDPIAQLLAPSDHVLAVQRVLTEYGYGPVRPTGVAGPETREAIKKFERARKMPVTGEISDRLVEALTQLNGRPLN
jgi:hypothetical protein